MTPAEIAARMAEEDVALLRRVCAADTRYQATSNEEQARMTDLWRHYLVYWLHGVVYGARDLGRAVIAHIDGEHA